MGKDEKWINRSPQEFIQFLKEQKIFRFFFVYEKNKKEMICSHPQLRSVADFILEDPRDFMAHEGLFFQISPCHDTLQGAFIHRTNRGQAAGGVRYWHYDTLEEYLRDGLRLAKGMTRKNALAGLWWGGGKGVMAHNPGVDKQDPSIRAALYQGYGELMTSIRGCYVTAEDVGTHVADMAHVFSKTRFTTCIPETLGGSGNPSIPTARGVVSGMEAALKFLKDDFLEEKIVAIQGMGNVGEPLIDLLFEKNVKKVIASDVDPLKAERMKELYRGKNLEARVNEPGDDSILFTECNILSPCATGAILNPRLIPNIKAEIICGAANNQLEDSERDDLALHEKGILYVPDFLTNRMGIVNCSNEQYGYVLKDPFIERHLSKEWVYGVYQTALRVFQESQASGEPPSKVAIRMADKLSLENHPVFGHRGEEIIRSLVEDGWHEAGGG